MNDREIFDVLFKDPPAYLPARKRKSIGWDKVAEKPILLNGGANIAKPVTIDGKKYFVTVI